MTIAAARTHEYPAAHDTTTSETCNRTNNKYLQCPGLRGATGKGEPHNRHIILLAMRHKQTASGAQESRPTPKHKQLLK